MFARDGARGYLLKIKSLYYYLDTLVSIEARQLNGLYLMATIEVMLKSKVVQVYDSLFDVGFLHSSCDWLTRMFCIASEASTRSDVG